MGGSPLPGGTGGVWRCRLSRTGGDKVGYKSSGEPASGGGRQGRARDHRPEVGGKGSWAPAAPVCSLFLSKPPTVALAQLCTTQKSGLAAACLGSGPSILLVCDLGPRPSLWASVSHPSSSRCGFLPSPVLLCSRRTHGCLWVLLSWAGAGGHGCACSASSSGARRTRPQATRAWLRHPVFQAQAGLDGRGREGRGGRRGE